MKKTAAILLLLVFLFNLCGYRILLAALQSKADKALELLIDNHEYNDDELLELRVALNMPYQQRFTEFERHYGQVTVEGKTYNYVKRKIEGDVLVLKCIPNDSQDNLKNIAADITRSNSDHNDAGNTPLKSSCKVFSYECDHLLSITDVAITAEPSMPGTRYTDRIEPVFLGIPSQPPRA